MTRCRVYIEAYIDNDDEIKVRECRSLLLALLITTSFLSMLTCYTNYTKRHTSSNLQLVEHTIGKLRIP